MDDVVECPAGPGSAASLDITSQAFARRLGNLLRHRRQTTKRSVRQMARLGDRHFTHRELRRYEAGNVILDAVTAAALASLYQVELDAILPARTEIEIDGGGGIIRTGGVDALFEPGDPDSILETYLRLVRRLRDQERDEVIALRRVDIERLAAFLGRPDETVIEQLGVLMGATKNQRRVMVGMLAAGALVITVAVPTVAALSSGSGPEDPMGSGNPALNSSALDGDDTNGDTAPGLDGPDEGTVDPNHDGSEIAALDGEPDVVPDDVEAAEAADAHATHDDSADEVDEAVEEAEVADEAVEAEVAEADRGVVEVPAEIGGGTSGGGDGTAAVPGPDGIAEAPSGDGDMATAAPPVPVANDPLPADVPVPAERPEVTPSDPFADDEFAVGPPVIPDDEAPLVDLPVTAPEPHEDGSLIDTPFLDDTSPDVATGIDTGEAAPVDPRTEHSPNETGPTEDRTAPITG